MSRKHIATYPIYGSHPLSLEVDTSNRLGTGYIYKASEIKEIEQRLAKTGHPLRIRWRNDECWHAALEELKNDA